MSVTIPPASSTINAPAADPMPLPDKLSDVAQNIHEAGADSQNSAAAVATPGSETELTQEEITQSDAVNGLRIDTSKLDAGTEENSSGRITFEGVK